MFLSSEELTLEAFAAGRETLVERIDVPELKDALQFPRFFQIEATRLCQARVSGFEGENARAKLGRRIEP